MQSLYCFLINHNLNGCFHSLIQQREIVWQNKSFSFQSKLCEHELVKGTCPPTRDKTDNPQKWM